MRAVRHSARLGNELFRREDDGEAVGAGSAFRIRHVGGSDRAPHAVERGIPRDEVGGDASTQSLVRSTNGDLVVARLDWNHDAERFDISVTCAHQLEKQLVRHCVPPFY